MVTTLKQMVIAVWGRTHRLSSKIRFSFTDCHKRKVEPLELLKGNMRICPVLIKINATQKF